MNSLVAFVGWNDPYAPGLAGRGEWEGPVLTLAAQVDAGEAHLLADPALAGRAAELAALLEERMPGIRVRIHALPACDPAEAATLQPALAAAVRDASRARDGGHVYACLPADRPAATVAWLSLPPPDRRGVRFVEVVPRRYAGDQPAAVREIAMPAPGSSRSAPVPQLVREPAAAYGAVPPALRAPPPPAIAPEEAALRIGIRGGSPAMRRAMDTAASVAAHSAPVLLCGETGTGKGLFASLIHTLSGRDPARFVSVNCAALPEQLVESILFGHRKGAFTGAGQDQPGKFELANGGTLFLDEVGELPLALQPKLLKAVEERIVEPLGARSGMRVDVRVIAATHRDLRREVAEKRFREDLYYRLSFVEIRLPPLRERREDIRHIALHILDDLNRGLRRPKSLAPQAVARLESQEWRGNVRDLANAIGRSVLLADKDVLDAEDLLIGPPAAAHDPLAHLPTPHESFSLEGFLGEARRQLMLRALDMAAGNQSAAARLLGITPQAVHKFLRSQPPGC
jgi:transcriptional regulator with AAA-type ATPase domain